MRLIMQFYYRRGNRYFFRSKKDGKIAITKGDWEYTYFKRGENYIMEFITDNFLSLK